MELKLDNTSGDDLSSLYYITALQQQFSRDQEEYELEFSIYISGGQGVTLSREIFRLPMDSHLIQRLKSMIKDLSPGQELAFHSNIYSNSKIYSLPLIDFTFTDWSTKDSVLKKIKLSYPSPLLLFSSGRSYHGCLLQKMSKAEWHQFLGRLLLLNPPQRNDENIDSRWIGHSLENDFSALRLSFNSNYYLKVPTYIATI